MPKRQWLHQRNNLDFYLSKAEATSNGKAKKNMTAHRHSYAFFPT
jgi:hypothetical protein